MLNKQQSPAEQPSSEKLPKIQQLLEDKSIIVSDLNQYLLSDEEVNRLIQQGYKQENIDAVQVFTGLLQLDEFVAGFLYMEIMSELSSFTAIGPGGVMQSHAVAELKRTHGDIPVLSLADVNNVAIKLNGMGYVKNDATKESWDFFTGKDLVAQILISQNDYLLKALFTLIPNFVGKELAGSMSKVTAAKNAPDAVTQLDRKLKALKNARKFES